MASLRTVENVVCPFCSMACDDLTIAVDGLSVRLERPSCPLAERELARVSAISTACRVDGREATLEEAVGRAAEILGAARLPLLCGLGTDLAGMREVMALAERLGGVVDHAGSPGLLANVRATQDEGWVTATLAEVRNRADLVLFVATDASGVAPRFVERCLSPREGLFGSLTRELVYLGDGLTPAEGVESVTRLPCPPERLPAMLAMLRAVITGGKAGEGELASLAARLGSARYPAIVWAAGQLPGQHVDLLVAAIAGLIRELNRKGRCVGVPLAGPDNVIGVNQVSAWQSGVPLRTSFAGGVPDHDPFAWNGARLLATGATDALLWIASLREQPLPVRRPPTVALLRPDLAPPEGVEVLIPVGVPGVDHAGSLFRTDGVVAVPVRELRASGLPSAAEVLRQIADRLAA